MENQLRTACAYIRVSTEQQEELSPDSQKRVLKDYGEKNNIVITKYYEDLGISGRKAEKRPEFQHMITDCKSKEHPYDVVLVWKFSRFARNQEESIMYKSILNKSKVEVISVSEALPDGMIGGLVERIFEWMDEYYSINLSGEAKRGWEEKRLKGGYASSCPYGYTYIKNEIPVINEQESLIVRQIFDMYLYDDRSASYITKWLNQNGYRTKFGRAWDNRYVLALLINPFYAGKIRWKAYDELKHLRPRSEWVVMDGDHEPLITMEEFEKSYAKRMREGAMKKRGANGCKNWLSGLVKCPYCKSSLIFCKQSIHNYAYFRCRGYITGICKHPQFIMQAKLENAIIDGLKNIITVDFSFSVIKDTPVNQNNESIKKQVAEIEKKMKRIKSAYVNGIDTLEEYKEAKRKLESEKESLLQNLVMKEEETTTDSRDEMISNIQKVITILCDEKSDMFRKSDAIRSICEKIEFDKDSETISFFFYLS